MLDGDASDLSFLAVRLAQKHYEHLRKHEGDPLDVVWHELPDSTKQIWVASMTDLVKGLSRRDLETLTNGHSDTATPALGRQ